jgi:hypothetical protein
VVNYQVYGWETKGTQVCGMKDSKNKGWRRFEE